MSNHAELEQAIADLLPAAAAISLETACEVEAALFAVREGRPSTYLREVREALDAAIEIADGADESFEERAFAIAGRALRA